MEDRIKKVMSVVLGIDVELINEESSADTVENWDSFNHMNLILALEDEFEVRFDDINIEDFLSYSLICCVVNGKIRY